MADGQIISRANIRARARAAFYSNKPRNSHGMNPCAAALADWLAEYDRCTANEAKCTRPVWACIDSAQKVGV